jgi:hypothetical protein
MNACSRRSVLGAALAAVAAPAVLSAQEKAAPAAAPAAAKAGRLTDASLGTLLKAMGLDAKLNDKRYDFTFKSTVANDDWDLSMSAVLSLDGNSIWIMAWLDECPKSAADVPRLALLRLLSENDKLGKGKFFAYIASNKRFVLQRVIPNENMSTAAFRAALDDLGQSVVQTHPMWSVANWTSTSPATEELPATAKTGAPVKGSAPQAASTRPAQPAAARPLQQAGNEPKIAPTTKK